MSDAPPPIPIDPLDHQGLVRSVARQLHRRYRLRHLDLEDLVSAGQFGLLHAITLFDPSLQERFDVYARYWIRHSIQLEICGRELLMRVPPYQWKPRGYDPNVVRSRAKYRAAVDRARSTASLDAPAGDGPGAIEALVDRGAPDPLAGLVREDLRRALGTLPVVERRVVEARYGLDGGEPRLGRELAEVLGVTRQRVSQLELRALARLRAILGGEAPP